MSKRIRKPKKFSKVQPKDGDSVVLCGHETSDSWHFWKLPEDHVEMTRPDGSTFEPLWIVACQSCFLIYAKDPLQIPIRDDAKWKGGAPFIEEPIRN